MPIEMSTDRVICPRCGMAYSRRKGYFLVSYAPLHKGIGYIPVCKTCIEAIYNEYLAQCSDSKLAVRQTCRKLDIFWSDSLFDAVEKKATPRSIVTQYIAKVNASSYVGRSYDDTLSQAGMLWAFEGTNLAVQSLAEAETPKEEETPKITLEDVPEKVKLFWGPGYSPETYLALEERMRFVVAQLPEGVDTNDMGVSTLIRQIAGLELDIARDREAGKPVDRSVTALDGLLRSANLRPVQQKSESGEAALANTPMGVWLYRYENKRPLPEVDDDLKDTNKLLKYVFVWLGHVCKMLGKKNGFVKMYEDEVSRLRVERPDLDDEDDEEAIMDILGDVDATVYPESEDDDDEEREDS